MTHLRNKHRPLPDKCCSHCEHWELAEGFPADPPKDTDPGLCWADKTARRRGEVCDLFYRKPGSDDSKGEA